MHEATSHFKLHSRYSSVPCPRDRGYRGTDRVALHYASVGATPEMVMEGRRTGEEAGAVFIEEMLGRIVVCIGR